MTYAVGLPAESCSDYVYFCCASHQTSIDTAYTYTNPSHHILIPTMDAVQAGVAVGASDKKEVINKLSLCRLMAFMGGYEPNYIRAYSEAEILEFKPKDVAKLLKQHAYHTPNPGPNDRPLYCRESTLVQLKKGISIFMPHRDTTWNVQANYGNPTRSREVNDVLRSVKNHEVRKEGLPSQSKRDLKRPEYRKTLRLLEQSSLSQMETSNF
jgi:hypothetical protein